MKAQNKILRPSDFDPEFLPAIEGVDLRTLTRNWWVVLLRGIAGIIFGLVTFFAPGISLAALVLVFGTGEWLLALTGIASIGLGVLLMLFPGAGALALVLWIGAYALVFGVLLIAF